MSFKSGMVDLRRTSFRKEAVQMQRRARRGETAVVRLAQIILFCANTDAWMLDLEHRVARPLMREGVALPIGITEAKGQLAITWNGDYAIKGDIFIWRDRESGTETRFSGYPMRVVVEMAKQQA